MKAQIKVGSNFVTGEGTNPMEVFAEVAQLTEVFGDTKCLKCGGTELKYVLRKATDAKGKKEYLYPECHCLNKDCKAKLSYSQTEDGIIYPKRFQKEDGEFVLDKDGKRVIRGNWGWCKYSKEKGEH